MHRRYFIGSGLAAAITLGPALQRARAADDQGASQDQPDPDVRSVLVMFKCHFDLGFIDTQAGIMRKYFEDYFPKAIEVAESMRASGPDRYVWTTGSWLLYEYLEQAASVPRERMQQAISRGDIAWHALPFSWQTELLNRSMITGALGLSRELDRRFHRTTTGAKMTDVPGHSRGFIAPLAQSGITFLDIGVNSASTPPDVPALFVWKNEHADSLAVMYHHKDYGGVMRIPGSNLAVAVEVRDDNSGPHTLAEIHQIYANLRRRFPRATIQAANLTDIANAVTSFRNTLPVVTQEIGDTWIYGVASDPLKLARFRELMRLRAEWIAAGHFQEADATDVKLLRRLLLAAEHTWGTDTKTWLDFDHYKPRDLAAMLDQPHYRTVTHSWVEKREDLEQGIATLPPALRTQATQRLQTLQPLRPSTEGFEKMHAGQNIEAKHFTIALDPHTGAIQTLRSRASQREWASPSHPLALFVYQTLSKSDYDRFLAAYVTSQADWAPKDFGKPNIEHFGAQSRTWIPRLLNSWTTKNAEGERLLAELEIADTATLQKGLVAWPGKLYLEIFLPDREPLLELRLTWFDKPSNRLPEALWLTFQPNAPHASNWLFEKVDEVVAPGDVVRGGSRHLHAISRDIRYRDDHGAFSIASIDAPLIALGQRSPIAFSLDQPDLDQGIHFSLFNNAWGTNYVQWFGEDMTFRFQLRCSA